MTADLSKIHKRPAVPGAVGHKEQNTRLVSARSSSNTGAGGPSYDTTGSHLNQGVSDG